MDALKAKAPDLGLTVLIPEEVMGTMTIITATPSQAAPQESKSFLSQFIDVLSRIGPGVPVGSMSPAEQKKYMNRSMRVAGWVLVVMTAGEAAPVLRPILVPVGGL